MGKFDLQHNWQQGFFDLASDNDRYEDFGGFYRF